MVYLRKDGDISIAAWYGSFVAIKKLIDKSSKSNKEIALLTSSMMEHLNIVIEREVEPLEECIELSNCQEY